MGSHENLGSPSSPAESSQPHRSDWQQNLTRKNSLLNEQRSANRRTSMQETSEHVQQPHQQSTSEMFKDLLSQKRNMILSKLTSFDSDVSVAFVAIKRDSLNCV